MSGRRRPQPATPPYKTQPLERTACTQPGKEVGKEIRRGNARIPRQGQVDKRKSVRTSRQTATTSSWCPTGKVVNVDRRCAVWVCRASEVKTEKKSVKLSLPAQVVFEAFQSQFRLSIPSMASSSALFAVQAKERLGAGRRKDEDGGVRKLPTPKSQLHGEADPHPHEGGGDPNCGTINKPGASVGAGRSWLRGGLGFC